MSTNKTVNNGQRYHRFIALSVALGCFDKATLPCEWHLLLYGVEGVRYHIDDEFSTHFMKKGMTNMISYICLVGTQTCILLDKYFCTNFTLQIKTLIFVFILYDQSGGSGHSKIFDIWSGACFRGLSSYFAPFQSYLLILRVVCPFCPLDRQLNSLFQRITEILLNI